MQPSLSTKAGQDDSLLWAVGRGHLPDHSHQFQFIKCVSPRGAGDRWRPEDLRLGSKGLGRGSTVPQLPQVTFPKRGAWPGISVQVLVEGEGVQSSL